MLKYFIFIISLLSCLGNLQAGNSGFGSEFENPNILKRYISPFKGIKKVAIVPFFSITENVDPKRFDLAFASQIENYPGWEVVYPQMVSYLAKSQNKTIVTPHDAITMARQLGADAVILGEIRDFDAYYPPRIVVKVALYRTNLNDSSRDVMNLMREGIADDRPYFKKGQAIYELSESYDAGREHVMKLIKRYAALFDQTNSPMQIDLFLRSQDKFFEAISYTIRQDMLYSQNTAAKMELESSKNVKKTYTQPTTSSEYRNIDIQKRTNYRRRRGGNDD